MQRPWIRSGLVLFLAAVFTVGLAFATVEIPYLVDGFIQGTVTTPGLDSHADEVSRLKTELFIAHYHLRTIGYVAFGLLVGLIVAGFSTACSGFATLGALGLMLVVFAQFAGVMFFLAGLGALNVLWLPVLDLPFAVPELGAVIRAPYDGARWLLATLGVEGTYWPVVLFCVVAGLLVFFLGTLSWLSARARKEPVATGWVYRLSRHPQYLGWIVWSYGVYLLLLRGLYPRRSWGIDASLPWLLSTMVIVGVALLEELEMRRRHGEAYECYRESAPFLFPMPAAAGRLLAAPLRLIFRKRQFERRSEVAAMLAVYTVLLMGASAFFYGPGIGRAFMALSPTRDRATAMAELAGQLSRASGRMQGQLGPRLADFGEDAVPHFITLLEEGSPGVRSTAAEQLGHLRSLDAVPTLVKSLNDPDGNVRRRAATSLGAIACPEALQPLLDFLEQEADAGIRGDAVEALAHLGSDEVLPHAAELLSHDARWVRSAAADALGVLGSEAGLPLLMKVMNDEEASVRRSAVVAVLRIGSPQGLPLTEAALDDEDWEVRLYAEAAAERLARR